jgi:hypothetical protein
MSLPDVTKTAIKSLLIKIVSDKLKNYNPETNYMPFHYNLLGKDRYAMFSFMQSMNTTFGMSIWEQVAVILAKGAGNIAQRQYDLYGQVDDKTEKIISEITYNLRKASSEVDKASEIKIIRDNIKQGKTEKDPDSRVDFYVVINGIENYFDITSVKPNIKEFAALKAKLLRWVALRLSQNDKAKLETRLAIPYNPYYPEPYQRWTLRGLYDLKNKEISESIK